ncbi:unnamed protein product, partial [Musa acuminata var. zebrina]
MTLLFAVNFNSLLSIKFSVEQHSLKHNDAGCLIQALDTIEDVPCPLVLKSGVNFALARMMELDVSMLLGLASEVFEESRQSLACGTLDYLRGRKVCNTK